METSAFGVEHEVSKGAFAAGLQPTLGGSASAPKGKKLRTGLRTTAGGLAGAVAGGLAGSAVGAPRAGALAGQFVGGSTAYRTSKWGREERKQNEERGR